MDTPSNEEITTRQSSKLSLGSSPSVLSADEQLEGDGPLTPTDKMEDDEEDDEDEDDDDLSALNSILQAGSPGSLSNEEVSDDEDDLHTEQDSASPLSSVPDDFPLSRSASPELLPLVEPMQTLPEEEEEEEEEDEEEEDEEEEEEEVVEEEKVVVEKKKLPTTRKRRNKDDVSSPNKKTKAEKVQPAPLEEQKMIEETSIRKRRASRSITNNIMPEPLSRPRRRQSRQDEQVKEQEIEQEKEVMEDKSNDDDDEDEEEGQVTKRKNDDDDEEEEDEDEEDEKSTENNKDNNTDELKKTQTDTPLESNGDSEDQKMSEPQENDDHDYQQRHKEALDALTHIEVEFARLRDKMYEEKMSELNEEAMMIANGTHPELVTLMAEIEEKKGKRIHSAAAWRKHQHANFKQQFEGFEYQANIHFISQKNALRRNLLSSINGKRWNIEDERTQLNDPARNDRVFPDGREMVAHKREQKEETVELQDIKETVGFPMAPNPAGLSLQNVEDDLKLLGINRNL
ncbi:Sds3-like-domain-containing protein [Pilaira anomala]|nr:Sds3-like-domain-containing protein [Pilaira anomala]